MNLSEQYNGRIVYETKVNIKHAKGTVSYNTHKNCVYM